MKKIQIYSSLEDRIDRLVHSRRKSLWVILMITAVAYSNIFFNSYLLDDFDFIVNWPLIRNLLNLPRFFVGFIPPDGHGDFYFPLKTLFHSVVYLLSAGRPIGFHVVGLLTQLAGVYVVYLIASFLVRNALIAFLTALLFALHPIHVEAVTAMTFSTDTVGSVLLLFSFYHYAKAVRYEGSFIIPEPSPAGRTIALAKQSTSGWWDLVSTANYHRALGLAAPTVLICDAAMALPVILFFYDYFFSQTKRSLRFSFRRAVPFLFIVLFYLLVKSCVLGGIFQGHYLENSFYLTMMLMIKAWVQYLWLLAFPINLTIDHVIAPGVYSFNPQDFDAYAILSQSPLDPRTFLSFLVLAGLMAVGGVSATKKPLVTFCAGWFFISLLPVSNLWPSSVYFSERYLYLGSLAFCLLLSYGIHGLYVGERIGSLVIKRSIIVACVIGLVSFYCVRDLLRNRDWRDSVTIHEAAVKANPQSAFLRNDLGIVYFQYGQLDKAKESFEKAIALRPQESHFYFSAEETYSTLEKYDRSVALLKKAIELNPQFAEAYFNLAAINAFLGKESEARDHLQKAVEIYKRQNRILEAGQAIGAMESYLHLPKQLSDQAPSDFLLKNLENND